MAFVFTSNTSSLFLHATVWNAVLTSQNPLHCHLSHLSPLEVQTHFLLQLTHANNDHHDHSIIKQYYFCKRGPKYFAYIILRFIFFSSFEKNVFLYNNQIKAQALIGQSATCTCIWVIVPVNPR